MISQHLISAALALLASSQAQEAQQPQTDGSTIVVTGRPLDESERALRDCIARRCPTLEDIRATLTHAENQFVAGDYSGARRTLWQSRSRNRRAARQYPVAVSLLYRAGARITRHMGEDQEYERNARGVVQILKAGLPADHEQILIGRFDVADMFAHQRQPRAARREYEAIAAAARAANQPVIAGHAELRAAWLDYQMNKSSAAKARLEALAAGTDPRTRSIALGARVLLARLGYQEGRPQEADAVIRELASASFGRTLILSPPMQPIQFGNLGDRESSGNAPAGDPWRYSEAETGRETWVDVGFRVRADGRVEEAEILRSSGPTSWTRPVLTAIRGRIYSPSDAGNEDYRVERYSFTSAKMNATGSRIGRHSGEWRIEQIDLTER